MAEALNNHVLKCRKCGLSETYEAEVTAFEHTDCGVALALRYRRVLERVRQGFQNILDFRKIAGSDRYGALTRAEIEEELAVLDRALARDDNRELSKR